MDKIEIIDGKVVIRLVSAMWPNLTKKNPRYKKFTVAIELEKDEAKPLLDCMNFEHGNYLDAHPKSADLPVAPFCEDLENGLVKFNLQNRHEPELLSNDGSVFKGTIGEGSILNLVVETVPYTNPANGNTGVSLRVLGVQVVEEHGENHSVRELLGLSPLEESQGNNEDWDDVANL